MHAHCSLIHEMVHTLSTLLCKGIRHDPARHCSSSYLRAASVCCCFATQRSARAFKYSVFASLVTCIICLTISHLPEPSVIPDTPPCSPVMWAEILSDLRVAVAKGPNKLAAAGAHAMQATWTYPQSVPGCSHVQHMTVIQRSARWALLSSCTPFLP
jgi:hypothetical protein